MDGHTLQRLEFSKILDRLAEHASFSGGRQLALELLPSFDPAEVARRQAITAEARAFADRHGAPPLDGTRDVRPLARAAERGRTLLASELIELRDTLSATNRTRRALSGGAGPSHWPRLTDMAATLEPCRALHDAIEASLDDEGNVLDGASAQLRRVRGELRVARDRLSRHLDGIIASSAAREFLQEPLITQRNGRNVLPIKSEFRSRVPGVVHDTSDSGATVFVEPLAAVELGNRVRELEADEHKEVLRVLRGLSELAASDAEAIEQSVGLLAEIDLAFARGDLAHAMRASAPAILDGEPRFDFRAARHPLLDPNKVVAIDVHAGRAFRTLLITGPNTGGKTVALKTVGLLVLMAQSGLQIPALDGSEMTVFDGVFADIGDEQSIEQSLSTFSSHMTNIIAILREATARSLVLVDELGAGTDPAEGAALAGALLEHLRQRGCTTVASTHYSELKVYAHGTPDVANASVEFDIETLQPTYELTIGLPGRSNALAIASRLGLPDEVVTAARAGLTQADVTMEDLLAEIRDARSTAAADRAAAAESRRQADAWAARLETALAEVEAERSRVLEEAHRQAESELTAVRDAVERLLRDAQREEADAAARSEVAARAARAVEALRQAAPRPEPPVSIAVSRLAPGARVRVTSIGQTGELLRLAGNLAEVQLERMRVTVPVSDLASAVPDGEPAPNRSERTPRLQRAPGAPAEVPMELDLRGLRVEDGLEAMEAHIDRAVLAGLPWVRIIHGHGSGAMKAAVRSALRGHPSVTRSRPGERGEGADGVTVVYLE